jgi:hypothetical protein
MPVVAIGALTIGLVAVFLPLGMAIGYIVGSTFDAFMGTQLLPLFCVGGILFAKASGNKDEREMTSQVGDLLGHIVFVPLAALLWATFALWLFPQTSRSFLAMTGYTGGLHSLLFWGTLVIAGIRAVVGIAFVAIFAAVAAVMR